MKITDLSDIIRLFTNIGMKLIPLLGAIAFLVFIYGVSKYIKAAGSGGDLKKSKNLLIWGVIGLLVMVAIWGIITFLQSEFGFTAGFFIPQIHF
jgi:hypothetical protein